MMQEIKLYDPARTPSNWTDLVRPGQYAVFRTDVRSDLELLSPGQDSTCLVFDSLAEAETYCEASVDRIPNLRCDIYDHTGKSKPPTLTYVNKAHLKSPQKRVYWGWLLVAASLPCFWIEWHWNGTLIIPVIVGVNLLFAGLRTVYWGAGGVETRRSTRAH
jgi:hypothetical protein